MPSSVKPCAAWAKLPGTQPLTSFFKSPPPPPPGPGRPPKPPEKRGRPASTPATTTKKPAPAARSPPPAIPVAPRPTSPRIDWSTGEPLKRLTVAVNNWLERKGDIITADSSISLKHYASRVDISHETLRKYVCADVGKRRVLGACAGSLPVISVDTEQFTVDVIRRKDRANDGLNRREAVDMLQDLRPDLKRTQLMRAFDRNICRKNADSSHQRGQGWNALGGRASHLPAGLVRYRTDLTALVPY
mmetsp:Transcript_23801/g.54147  ORF Transcript_23801/g.54147 Transcript_23801/m.54147 type:complete len:246 (-) Transcript_23801:80-817(-)